METIAMVLAPAYLAMGLSMLLHVGSWQKLFAKYGKDLISLFPLMVFELVIGLIMVNMYNVWTWDLGLIVTLSGWGFVLEGVLFMLLPGKVLQEWTKAMNKKGLIYAAGFAFTLIGLVLGYFVYYL